jgi:hypothetical protein
MSKETPILRGILEYLNLRRDVVAWRMNVGAIKIDRRFIQFGFAGLSDIIGIFKGRFLAIEVKRPGAKMNDDQIIFQQRVEHFGGIHILAYSIDDVIAGLDNA